MQREHTPSRPFQRSAQHYAAVCKATVIENPNASKLALFWQGVVADVVTLVLCRFGVLNGTEINPDFAQGECRADRPPKLLAAGPGL